MELQHHDLRELAEFFAKRFPRCNDRRLLVDQLRINYREPDGQPPIKAWMDLLGRVRERRQMVNLGHAAQRLRPYDENLSSMVEILRRSESGLDHTVMRMATIAVGTLLVVGSSWAAIDSFDAPNPNDNINGTVAEAESVEHAETVIVHNESPMATTTFVPNSEAEILASVDLVQDQPEITVETLAPTPVMVTTRPANHTGRCTIADDGVVGYWYAGEKAPGNAGELVTVDHSVNVRADYPDHHNAYDARASVRCQLAAGDQIRLTAEPILVPGDRYWVPLYNGDLVRSDA